MKLDRSMKLDRLVGAGVAERMGGGACAALVPFALALAHNTYCFIADRSY